MKDAAACLRAAMILLAPTTRFPFRLLRRAVAASFNRPAGEDDEQLLQAACEGRLGRKRVEQAPPTLVEVAGALEAAMDACLHGSEEDESVAVGLVSKVF